MTLDANGSIYRLPLGVQLGATESVTPPLYGDHLLDQPFVGNSARQVNEDAGAVLNRINSRHGNIGFGDPPQYTAT